LGVGKLVVGTLALCGLITLIWVCLRESGVDVAGSIAEILAAIAERLNGG